MSDDEEPTEIELGPAGRELRAMLLAHGNIEIPPADISAATVEQGAAALARLRDSRDSYRDAFLDAWKEIREVVATRDRYWQALTDIAGHENWQPKTMGDIAREALGVVHPPERDGDRSDEQDV